MTRTYTSWWHDQGMNSKCNWYGSMTLFEGITLPRGEGNTRQGGGQYGAMNIEQWTLLLLPPPYEADD